MVNAASLSWGGFFYFFLACYGFFSYLCSKQHEKMVKAASRMAFKDITRWIAEQNLLVYDNYGDVWVVTPHRMDNKEQRLLNKMLGINTINYNKNNNAAKN